jgi:hypothetical protein
MSRIRNTGQVDSEAIYSFFCPVQKSKVAQPLNSFDSTGKTHVIHLFDQRMWTGARGEDVGRCVDCEVWSQLSSSWLSTDFRNVSIGHWLQTCLCAEGGGYSVRQSHESQLLLQGQSGNVSRPNFKQNYRWWAFISCSIPMFPFPG